MEEVVMGMFAMTGFFGSIILGLYLFFTTRHKERMALLESGNDASIFFGKAKPYSSNSLKFGLLFLGIGAGILLATLLSGMGMQEEPAYFSCMLVCGGLGLISYYRIEQRKNQEDLES